MPAAGVAAAASCGRRLLALVADDVTVTMLLVAMAVVAPGAGSRRWPPCQRPTSPLGLYGVVGFVNSGQAARYLRNWVIKSVSKKQFIGAAAARVVCDDPTAACAAHIQTNAIHVFFFVYRSINNSDTSSTTTTNRLPGWLAGGAIRQRGCGPGPHTRRPLQHTPHHSVNIRSSGSSGGSSWPACWRC